jgi:hypothetical protein
MRLSAVSCSSSAVRSCISRLARWESFQRLGSSACLFSSARRVRALSTSKMPPQQPERLLDVFDNGRDFRAHDVVSARRCNDLCGAPQVPGAIRQNGLDNYQ